MVFNASDSQEPNHEGHKSPYAILFIFTSCTIGGKIKSVQPNIQCIKYNFFLEKLVTLNTFFRFSCCSAAYEGLAYSLYSRFDSSRTWFWGNIRRSSRVTEVSKVNIYKLTS